MFKQLVSASPEAFPKVELNYLPWRDIGNIIAHMRGT